LVRSFNRNCVASVLLNPVLNRFTNLGCSETDPERRSIYFPQDLDIVVQNMRESKTASPGKGPH